MPLKNESAEMYLNRILNSVYQLKPSFWSFVIWKATTSSTAVNTINLTNLNIDWIVV